MGQPAKAVLVGSSGVGKTSLMIRMATGAFDEDVSSTIGACSRDLSISMSDREVRLTLWDTAGQERFRGLIPLYFRNSTVAVIVFSLADAESLRAVPSWAELVGQNSNVWKMFLVGNKADLIHHEVLPKHVTAVAAQIGAEYYETSARTGEGVKETMEAIAEAIVEAEARVRHRDLGLLEGETDEPKKKSRCC